MGLEHYRLDTGSREYYLALFQQNRMIRQRYKIRTKSGELLEGIPTTDARVGDTEPSFHVRGDQNLHYVIPFSDLDTAEPIALHDDRYFMSLAIAESRRCVSEQGVPRPLVGAVLVQEDSIVAKAFRGEITSGDHAEYELLETRLQGRLVAGSTLYTTLEPCTERGTTKEGKEKVPCAKRIIDRRIRRVVIGMLDPNQKIRGEGIWRLREAGVHVALCEPDQMAQIEEINRDFVRHFRAVKSGSGSG
jgi:pyrimidine deaminase RibD-like protein